MSFKDKTWKMIDFLMKYSENNSNLDRHSYKLIKEFSKQFNIRNPEDKVQRLLKIMYDMNMMGRVRISNPLHTQEFGIWHYSYYNKEV